MFSPPRLRAYRHLAHLDYGDLAERARLDPHEVEAIEHGTQQPTPDEIDALAAALGIDPAQLTTREQDPADNRHYWRVISRAWPPLSDKAVSVVAGIFDRIDARAQGD